ncbi:MAG: cytochrome c biogenesis protein CcsA, partial [Deltaproteobacteria bacterium]|nr:cytochrome c biogenesis protein CcsA [Deltaproteobacteria bacterium]
MDFALLAGHPLYAATGAAYAAAFAFYTLAWRSTKAIVGRLGTALIAVALAGNLWMIIARWMSADRPPFKSLFETLVFLAFCFAAVYLVMEQLLRTRAFGALASLGCVGALTFALVKWDAEIVQLPPALQSGWFVPHVVVYFVGYAALFFATLVSVVQLFRPNLSIKAGTIFQKPIVFEDVAYQTIRFGFVLLTFGLLVGAIWAKEAWGDYWVWDPKENWSLVSWLVYAAYLHLRHIKGWRGNRAAWLAIA